MPAALDRAYHALQGEVHPDRYAAASEAEQRLALQSSARVNEAYRALKDPVARAQYLLSLHGVEAFDETDTALPFDFLERQLERRELAETAMAEARRRRARNAASTTVRAEARELEQRVVVAARRRGRVGRGARDRARASLPGEVRGRRRRRCLPLESMSDANAASEGALMALLDITEPDAPPAPREHEARRRHRPRDDQLARRDGAQWHSRRAAG